MKTCCVLLSALLALGFVRVHGAPVSPGSCDDPAVTGAAKLALDEINKDRTEGYQFFLSHLSNANTQTHGEAGMVFYLTMDVVETNCSVLARDSAKSCVARELADTPFYGQCKAAIYISKVHRVVRLYKYNCAIRPVPASKLAQVCPDCPSLTSVDNEQVKETASLALAKFNKEGGLSKRFALHKIERSSAGMAMNMYYNVEFVIQETTCRQDAAETDNCPAMECEFAHKGFCTASMWTQMGDKKDVTVNCDIFEPEAAEKEKKLHLLGGETDHSHTDTHAHDPAHDVPHDADQSHTHDHVHDHTKSSTHTHTHGNDSDHHHTHDHQAGSGHAHAHDHSHDHGHGHDHVHTHHAKAHDHSGDSPNHHHDYKHADGVHTHEHDHELALDHDHKHAHLHAHEHHHHHHDHAHHDHQHGQDHDHHHHDHDHHHPEGEVRVLPSMDQPMTLPAFPDVPAAGPEVGVTLPLKPDPQIPGMTEPTIQPHPTTVGAGCSSAGPKESLVAGLLFQDPVFKVAA